MDQDNINAMLLELSARSELLTDLSYLQHTAAYTSSPLQQLCSRSRCRSLIGMAGIMFSFLGPTTWSCQVHHLR